MARGKSTRAQRPPEKRNLGWSLGGEDDGLQKKGFAFLEACAGSALEHALIENIGSGPLAGTVSFKRLAALNWEGAGIILPGERIEKKHIR